MGIESNISLMVAALDLKLVQLVRGAMASADAASGKSLGALGPAPSTPPRPVIHPEPRFEPRFEPRPVHHPTPRFEPRPVYHLTPRVVDPPPAVCPPKEPEFPRIAKSPIQPPWEVMPWETAVQPLPKVKLIKLKPDIVRKGSLIDCFI